MQSACSDWLPMALSLHQDSPYIECPTKRVDCTLLPIAYTSAWPVIPSCLRNGAQLAHSIFTLGVVTQQSGTLVADMLRATAHELGQKLLNKRLLLDLNSFFFFLRLISVAWICCIVGCSENASLANSYLCHANLAFVQMRFGNVNDVEHYSTLHVQYNWFRLAHDRTDWRQLMASVRT